MPTGTGQTEMPKLSFVTLAAYDYELLPQSIASYYDIADEIIVGVDEYRFSWKKHKFDLPEKFLAKLVLDDPQDKIKIVRSKFHHFDNPMQNETVERSYLKCACTGDWIIQIDADEVLLNPKEFAAYLETAPRDKCIKATWESVFKKVGDKYLVIDGKKETTSVATANEPLNSYVAGRGTQQETVMSPLRLLHFSWARTEEGLWQKLTNWGHADDFDTRKFFEFWKSLNENNYQNFRDFHPLDRVSWSSLKLIDLKDI
jgi:hypothetical protein